MYNGTGLQTARGSGTNAYTQTNKFTVKHKPFNSTQGTACVSKKPNKDILDHDRKRKIEVRLVELEEELIDQGFSEEEVKEKLDVARRKMEDDKEDGDVGVFEKRVT
ncbi:uncharacterized protein LOC141684505 [Apium graveolens]|uniref:uncharacterized protein LOC141684505 n=1 Tax=Apium graveolens TaxID=4045 RepID=UPI003D79FA83